MEKSTYTFEDLVRIMDELREKCPWDAKQTLASLRQQTIEELYELTDAITEQNWDGIREELGDLMLHIVFYTKMGTEAGRFTMEDVITGICRKLISRHPHVYGQVQVSGAEEVKQNWERLKLKEGKASVLSGVPGSLPALIKAMRLQEKASQVGFDWDSREKVKEKLMEEIQEWEEARAAGDRQKEEGEFGDLLFSLVNYSRFLKIDPENALELTNLKFIRRFTQMEKRAGERGLVFTSLTLVQMDELWDEIKAAEFSSSPW